MMRFHLKTNKRPGGFTLIELMVSIALFSVVIAIVAAAFTKLLSYNRIALSTNDVSNNLNFVVDSMARSIRTGTSYDCNYTYQGNCPYYNYGNGASTFTFVDDQGDTDTFILDTSKNQIGECFNTTTFCTTANANYQPLTDPNIKINALQFYVQGVSTTNTDGTQPQVTFVIQGQMTTDPTHAPVTFDIESGATERQINL
jgi:prepilin-type N-terminal cleavage/methylation domain-containing protein